ncbi:hypothetical protein B0J13DRAFT_554842 [Dactylonectria estremocensis]|uniref:Clr5 domain-containing protein n=1 Tax=Dactylonectria estremocensis TaxID=1079267 RepID=A0A9P9ETN2_9HYPO|nr:hypothetical protein B0J13DRAFT_554842 [Dactylonectria estremocensis]
MNSPRPRMAVEQIGLGSNGTVQWPTPEEWGRMKDHIYRIYILEGHTLKATITRMETDYGFKATEKMYNTFFKKSRPLFNKNRRSNDRPEDRQGVKIPRTRPRRLQSHLQNSPRQQKNRCILPYSFFDPQLSDGYSNQMALLNLTEVYVHGLFDTFDFSSSLFDIIVPPGVPENSSVWQQIADEGFGAATLMLNGDFVEGFRTFSILCQRLKDTLGNNDSAMIFKFWRICHRLYNTGLQLGNLSILYSFLQYFRGLAAIRYPENHPIPSLLRVLCNIPIGEFSHTLEVGYLRTILCLQNRVGFGNAVVLSLWSNYLTKFNRQAPSTDDILSRYRCVLEEAQQSFTLTGTRTIEILHGYTYAAYYNAGDLELTWDLAFDLVNRVESMEFVRDRPTWCHATQGFALAAKLLCNLSHRIGHENEGSVILKSAIRKLERGDRECRTRAVMLSGIIEAERVE